MVAVNSLGSEHRTIAAVEVADRPLALCHEDLGVVPADGLFFNDDVICWSTAHGDGAAGDRYTSEREPRAQLVARASGASASQLTMPLQPGTTLGPYEIQAPMHGNPGSRNPEFIM